MCKFIQVNPNNITQNLHYIPDIERCFSKYRKYLEDDFAKHTDIIHFIYTLQPCFWIITNTCGNFCGFVYLDNFVGNDETTYSAELTTCFDKKAWGNFTRYSANIFFKTIFQKTSLQKIKALTYPDNFRVKKLLQDTGFVYESKLKNETIRLGKPEDIEVYGLYRNYYLNK